ncbi:MAG: GSCFA domain-containing protein [Alphaproteobacteria bacterium]
MPAITPGFKMQREDKVFAIGSCFARGVELALIDQKMDVLSRTAEFDSFPAMNGELELGFTNKYNTFSIYNELRWALDPAAEFPRESLVDLGNGIFYDPHTNPALQLVGLEETIHRREIMQMVTRRISQCRVVIITLGLVEVWRDTVADVFINQLIPSMHSSYPDRYELHVTNFVENLSNLERIHGLLNQFGHQDVQIVVTVSPVPLQATFSGDDVVVANSYSKCLLRAVAQEWAAAHKNVHYFPSYEIVQNSDRNLTWEEDMRHVKGKVVRHIMNLFLRNYCWGLPVTSSKLCASPNPVPPGIGLGKTTITWSSHGAPNAAIYVSRDGIEEALFAGGSHGSKEASWIEAGATYEFTLYADRDRNTRLAGISVTRPQAWSAISRKRNRVKSARFLSKTTTN